MNDILTEREECAKIAERRYTFLLSGPIDAANEARLIGAAIRASPTPVPIITDEKVEKVAKAIFDLRHGEGAFEQEKSWRVSAGIEWRTSEPLFAEARAALVAALGGE